MITNTLSTFLELSEEHTDSHNDIHINFVAAAGVNRPHHKDAHKNNYEKIDAKIRTLMIDNQILKKIVQNFERRFRSMKVNMLLENFDENQSSESNKRSNNHEIRFRILRRNESLSNFENDLGRLEDETSFFKHKYFELSLFYENVTE